MNFIFCWPKNPCHTESKDKEEKGSSENLLNDWKKNYLKEVILLHVLKRTLYKILTIAVQFFYKYKSCDFFFQFKRWKVIVRVHGPSSIFYWANQSIRKM